MRPQNEAIWFEGALDISVKYHVWYHDNKHDDNCILCVKRKHADEIWQMKQRIHALEQRNKTSMPSKVVLGEDGTRLLHNLEIRPPSMRDGSFILNEE